MTNSSFSKDYRLSLELLVPYAVLCAVIMAALFSEGSWTIFFDKSLPRWLGILALMWLVLGAYFTSLRRRGAVGSAGGYGDDDSMELFETNPANGLPMMNGVDIEGNPSGLSDND